MQLQFRSVVCKSSFSLQTHCFVIDIDTGSIKIVPHLFMIECWWWTLLSVVVCNTWSRVQKSPLLLHLKLSFSTKRLEKKKEVLIVFWDIWREGGGYQFMNVLSANKWASSSECLRQNVGNAVVIQCWFFFFNVKLFSLSLLVVLNLTIILCFTHRYYG